MATGPQDRMESLVRRSEFTGVVINPAAATGAPATTAASVASAESVERALQNRRFIEQLKARLAASTAKVTPVRRVPRAEDDLPENQGKPRAYAPAQEGEAASDAAYKTVGEEYAANKDMIDGYLERIAQTPGGVDELRLLAEEAQDQDEAMSIAIQAMGLRDELNKVKDSSTDPSAVVKIQEKLSQLQGRAAGLRNSRQIMGLITAAQSSATAAFTVVTEAASRLIEGIGWVAGAIGKAASAVGDFFSADDFTAGAKRFEDLLQQNSGAQFKTAQVDANGNVVARGDDISGGELRQHFDRLRGRNTGMNNPLLKQGKLQILENDDVNGEKRTPEMIRAAERIEAAFMKESLSSLEKVKAALLLEEAKDKGEQALADAKATVKKNRKLFKAAEEQIDTVLALRDEMMNARDEAERAQKAEELKKAKAKLKLSLRKIANDVLGESPEAGISMASNVEGPGAAPMPSTETARRVDPAKRGNSSGTAV